MFLNYKEDKNDHRKIVGYSRVSSKEQTEGYSILNQNMTIERIAKVLGEKVVHIYSDKGKSAYKKAVTRPEFNELIQDIKKNEIKVIIVWKSDRLIRNFIKSERINQLLIKYKVTLISATEFLDFTTADGRKEMRKRSIDNQYESERTSERVKEVNKASAKLGNFPKGHVPLGYRRMHNEYPAAPIVVDETEGEKVAAIFLKVYEMRWGVKKLMHWLKSEHYLDRSWNESVIYRLLMNPIYIGTYVDNVKNPTYSYPNHSPALIDKELFDTVGAMIHGKNYDKKYKYIFKGYIFCKECGKKLVPMPTYKKKQKKLYLYYYCESCNKRINEEKLQKKLLWRFNAKIIDISKDTDNLQTKIKEHNRLEYMIKKLDDWFKEGIVSQEYYTNEKQSYFKQKNAVEKYIKTIRTSSIIWFEEMDYLDKRQWLKDYVHKIYYDPEEGEAEVDFSKLEVK